MRCVLVRTSSRFGSNASSEGFVEFPTGKATDMGEDAREPNRPSTQDNRLAPVSLRVKSLS